MNLRSAVMAAALIFAPCGALAQESASTLETAPPPTPSGERAVASATLALPLGTWVQLETVDAISSNTATIGQQVALRLAEPVSIDGHVLIPAGTPAFGEVIDAKPNGIAGRTGVLVVAARYLEMDGRRVDLEGLVIGGAGRNGQIGMRVTSAVIGVAGTLVRGGRVDVAAGSRVEARLAGGPPEIAPAITGDSPVPSPEPGTATVVFFGNGNNFYRYGVAENGTALVSLPRQSYRAVSLPPGPHAFAIIPPLQGGRPLEETLRVELLEGEIMFIQHNEAFLAPSNETTFQQRRWRPAEPVEASN